MPVQLAPLILTLKFDDEAFARLDKLRKQYFPPAVNFIPAHLTLFHALPGAQENVVRQTLAALAGQTKIMSLDFPRLRSLGKGVAIEVECLELIELRKELVRAWEPHLSAQDRQKSFRPHVTIQNKVAPDAARELYNRLESEWQPFEAQGVGLLLWHYEGGPWKLATEFSFIS